MKPTPGQLALPLRLTCLAFFGLQQVVEERAVVHHRPPQVFGLDAAAGVPFRDHVGGPVLLDHMRMIDRDVSGSLVEIPHRVAAVAHHILDQRVRLRDGCRRVVHELGLRLSPFREVSVPLACRQRLDLVVLDAFLARLELALRLPLVAGRLQRSLVFRPVSLGQMLGPIALSHHPRHRTNHDDRHQDDERDLPELHLRLLIGVVSR